MEHYRGESSSRFLLNIYQVVRSLGGNVFGSFLLDGKPYRMVPTLGLMQTFLVTKFGSQATQAINIHPVLGISSLENIKENGLTGSRDLVLRSPLVKLPEIADDFAAPGDLFTYHDFYHAMVASSTPLSLRPSLIALADTVSQLELHCNNQQVLSQLKRIQERIIDLEAIEFMLEMATHSHLTERKNTGPFLVKLSPKPNSIRSGRLVLHMTLPKLMLLRT